MKTKRILLIVSVLFISAGTALAGNIKSEKFKVYGKCGMCETRIEKAASNLDGVQKADWNAENQMLEVQYDESKVSSMDIHKAVAKVGHDTDKVKAEKEVYNNLPECCKYKPACETKEKSDCDTKKKSSCS